MAGRFGGVLLSQAYLFLYQISKFKQLFIALRIEAVFGGTADFWLRMQRGFDLMEEKIKFKNNPPNVKKINLQSHS
jgi:hypothetical protein